MISEEKIIVFISSKCGGEEINPDKLVSADEAIRTGYNLVRRALKLSLEETGIIKPYIFEEDLPSTSSAGEDYINAIDKSDVCLFLIDNFDENISGGLLKEITRAQEINKKTIYLFLNDPGREITSIQEKLKGERGHHYKTIRDIRDFIDIGYKAIINDIVEKYQQYSKENFDTTKKAASSIEITGESFPTEVTTINKQIFNKLGLTKNRIASLVYNQEEKDIQSSDLDKLCLAVLEVLFGEKQFSDVNLKPLLEKLMEIQSPEFNIMVSKRWEAISSFYKGDLDNAIKTLEFVYEKYSKDVNVPKWLLNDVLLDLGYLNYFKNQASNVFNFSVQEKIDEESSFVFFPLADRFSVNISNDIWVRNFDLAMSSPYSKHFFNLGGLFDFISNYLFSAIYYGSLSSLNSTLYEIQKVLFELVKRDSNLLYKIQLMRIIILRGDEDDFVKIMGKYKSSLSHSTTKEILDLYKLADTKSLIYQKANWKIILFKEIGYYFSDIDYEMISKEIIDLSYVSLGNDNPNNALIQNLIEALKFNIDRLPQEKIINFALEVFKNKYSRFFDSIFDLLSKLNMRSMSQELINSLLLQIKEMLVNEDVKKRLSNIKFFLIIIRKNRDDFITEIDEIVEKYYPEFYKNEYHLEIHPKERIIHIQRYLDNIKARNKVQGVDGKYMFYGDDPYLTIKNIIEFDKISLSVELLSDLLKEIANTLFSERQTYSAKISSIQLILSLKRQDLSHSYDWDNYYSDLKQNIAKAEKGNSDFFGQESDLLLKLSLLILRESFGEDCLPEILEILAFINNGSNREIIDSLIALEDFLKVEKNNLAEKPLISVLIQYVSAFCFHEDNDVRYCTVLVLYQLLDSQYSSFVVNRLVKMMDDNDFKVKYAIVKQASLIKKHSVTAFNYVTEKAKIDNNYLVRKAIEPISEK